MHNKKDITEKKLEDYPEVFADIFNVLLFRKEYIEKEHLKSGPTESIYKEQLQSRLQQRDVLKYYKGVGMNVASLGIENQSAIDKYMPIRVMGYDYGSYRHQVDHEELYHELEHVDEVIDLLRTFNEHTDDNKLDQLIIKNQNGGNVTMCDIIKEI